MLDRFRPAGGVPQMALELETPAVKRKRSKAPDTDRFPPVRKNTYPLPPDQQHIHLNRLKAESRHAVASYDYARAVLLSMRRGVLGSEGIRFRSTLDDEVAREAVEDAWTRWGMCCDSAGRLNFRRFELAVLNSLVIDGEAVVLVENSGESGYSLRLIDSVLLDAELHGTAGANTISLGVEKDPTGQVVAYHFSGLRPDNTGAFAGGYVRHQPTRVAAERVIHVFDADLPGQSRGVPWLSTACRRFADLQDYEESERTAARVSARKLGFVQVEGDADVADDEEGDNVISTKPGSITHLDPGESFHDWDPAHPNTAFPAFVQSQLRGAAGGVGLSYFELGNDLAGVNFSSGRIGLISQRELWRMTQRLLVDTFHDRVFAGWLETAMLRDVPGVPRGAVPSDVSGHRWVGRRYDHVQPREQATSDHQRIEDGLTSRSEIIRSEGRDPEDVFSELAAEAERLRALDKRGTVDPQEQQE